MSKIIKKTIKKVSPLIDFKGATILTVIGGFGFLFIDNGLNLSVLGKGGILLLGMGFLFVLIILIILYVFHEFIKKVYNLSNGKYTEKELSKLSTNSKMTFDNKQDIKKVKIDVRIMKKDIGIIKDFIIRLKK